MTKVKLKRFIAMTMAAMITLSSNAFATEIDLENSNANVNKHGTVTKDSGSDTFNNETTNVWQNGSISEEVRVNVDVASSFTITIPKEIVLNGNNGSASYKVKCEGELAGDQVIYVVPDTNFILNEDGGKTTPVTVTQPDTDFTYVELNDAKEYNGDLSAPEISAGNWSGSFYFNIRFKAEACEHDYVLTFVKEATETENGITTYTCSKCAKSYTLESEPCFSNMSWKTISDISKSGRASEVFNIGDEKDIVINNITYRTVVIGTDHDDLSDGSGKAGLTIQLLDCYGTQCMNAGNEKTNNWKDCYMRRYLNDIIINELPSDLSKQIKTVNKISNINNDEGFVITQDKLFLLSTTEVGINYSLIPSNNQGEFYEYFFDYNVRQFNPYSRKRFIQRNNLDFLTEWWLRTSGSGAYFDGVTKDGEHFSAINGHYGVAFAFCI